MMVVRFLPMVSAKCPKMKAPNGRPISVVAKIIGRGHRRNNRRKIFPE